MKEQGSEDISHLKEFLTQKNEEVINLHYGKGKSVSQICMEFGNKYSKELFYPHGHFLRAKPTIPEHLLNILGYPDWEIYNKRLPRLKSRARYRHGFTPKLRNEIFKKYNYSCDKCEKSEKRH